MMHRQNEEGYTDPNTIFQYNLLCLKGDDYILMAMLHDMSL